MYILYVDQKPLFQNNDSQQHWISNNAIISWLFHVIISEKRTSKNKRVKFLPHMHQLNFVAFHHHYFRHFDMTSVCTLSLILDLGIHLN